MKKLLIVLGLFVSTGVFADPLKELTLASLKGVRPEKIVIHSGNVYRHVPQDECIRFLTEKKQSYFLVFVNVNNSPLPVPLPVSMKQASKLCDSTINRIEIVSTL